MTVGLVSRDLNVAQVVIAATPADVFLGDNLFALAAIASPHLDEAMVSPGVEDLAAIDFEAVPGVDVGDQLAFEYVFAQTLEIESLLVEAGLTDVELFARRWNAGHLRILAAEGNTGVGVALARMGAEVRAGSALATFASKGAAVLETTAGAAVGGAVSGATVGAVEAAVIPVVGPALVVVGAAGGAIGGFLGSATTAIATNLPSSAPPSTVTVIGDGPPGVTVIPQSPLPPSPALGADRPPGPNPLTIQNIQVVRSGPFFALIFVAVGGEGPYRAEVLILDRDPISGILDARPAAPLEVSDDGDFWIPGLGDNTQSFDVTIVVTDETGGSARRDVRVRLGPQEAILDELSVAASVAPMQIEEGEAAVLSVEIGGTPTNDVLTAPFTVTIFDDQSDFVESLVVDDLRFTIPIAFSRIGPHVVTVEIRDAAGLNGVARTNVEVLSPNVEGPGWRLDSTEGNPNDATLRRSGSNDDSFSSCTIGEAQDGAFGQLEQRSVIVDNGGNLQSEMFFTFVYEAPPAFILPGEALSLTVGRLATGIYNAGGTADGRLEYHVNGSNAGGQVRLRGFDLAFPDNPSPLPTDDVELMFSVGSTGSTLTISALLLNIPGCRVDWTYSFVQ